MDSGNDSPPSRTAILTSFLRGRPRNSPDNNNNHATRDLSPPPQPPSPNANNNRRSRLIPSPPPIATPMTPPTTTTGLGLSQMLRGRRRSVGALASPAQPTPSSLLPAQPSTTTTAANTPITSAPATTTTTLHRIRLVPHIEGRRSLRFDAIPRDLREGDPPIRIGRFTDRSGIGLAAINAPNSNKLAFRSKVVSRAHAEIWVEPGPLFFVRDTKSSSGTFLNHARLSPANMESRPFQMKDGDILQLGVDYQGGTEDIFKSVKIRVEIGREWQAGPNAFNTTALKNIRSLVPTRSTTAAPNMSKQPVVPTGKSQLPDCCICLFSVTIRQALFIAPCSHVFHYKCIRPYLETHHPAFSCPLCRSYADLDEDVEVEVDCEGDVNGTCEEGEEGEVEIEIEVDEREGERLLEVEGEGEGGGDACARRPKEDRGAETEVEMDFCPSHHPGIGGPTLIRRPGLRIATTATTPTVASASASASPPRQGGRVPGGLVLVMDEDEEGEMYAENENGGVDRDEVMLDLAVVGGGMEGVVEVGAGVEGKRKR